MTYTEAEKLASDNQALIGKNYKQILISAFIIMPIPLNEILLTVVAQQLKDTGEYWPDKRLPNYELYIVFDLADWTPSKQLQFGVLSDFLSRLDYKYIH